MRSIDELALSLEIQDRLIDGLKGDQLLAIANILNINLDDFTEN